MRSSNCLWYPWQRILEGRKIEKMKGAAKVTFLVFFSLLLIKKSSGFEAEGSIPTVLGTSSPPVVYTEHGKSIRLKCIYHSEIEPKVDWMKDGVGIRKNCDTCISTVETRTDIQTSFLEITPYINEDYGDYECRVRTKYGSAKMKVSLKKTDVPETKCEKERVLSRDPRKKHSVRPVCNEDGSYHEVQCSLQHDTCWCVNKYGKKTLDVIDGANGLRCFAPKDLSVVAIVVLTQGILVTLLLIDQILNTYTDYSIYGALRNYYHQRMIVFRKGYKVLKKEMEENTMPMKSRPLPDIPRPSDKQKRNKRKAKS